MPLETSKACQMVNVFETAKVVLSATQPEILLDAVLEFMVQKGLNGTNFRILILWSSTAVTGHTGTR